MSFEIRPSFLRSKPCLILLILEEIFDSFFLSLCLPPIRILVVLLSWLGSKLTELFLYTTSLEDYFSLYWREFDCFLKDAKLDSWRSATLCVGSK